MNFISLKITLFFFLAFNSAALAQSASIQWARSIGGYGNDIVHAVIVDKEGNIYTTGKFDGIVDFDPGPGVYNLICVNSSFVSSDMFVSKLDSGGNLVWAKGFSGPGEEEGRDIAVDGNGNVYITGYFYFETDFDPDTTVFSLHGIEDDIFVLKLNSDGNLVWAKSMGGQNYDQGISIKVDNKNNVYTTGWYSGIADFDPDTGTFNLMPRGFEDIFISKLDSNGKLIWAKGMGWYSSDWASSLALDNSGNICITGNFTGLVDFDPGPGTFTLPGSGVFISKYTKDGDFMWAKAIYGNHFIYSNSIVTDSNRNIFTVGSFYDTADFDPGQGIHQLVSAGYDDIFISKMDSNGNFSWASKIGGANSEDEPSVTLDEDGNVYTTGSFRGSVDFDPGPDSSFLVSTSNSDIFISKFSPAGNFISAMDIGGHAGPSSIAVERSGNIYISGWFIDTLNLFAQTNFELVSQGNEDIFVVKLNQTTVGFQKLAPNSAFTLFPNPANASVSILLPEKSKLPSLLTIYNTMGEELIHEEIKSSPYQLELNNIQSGIYFIKTSNEEIQLIRKLIISK